MAQKLDVSTQQLRIWLRKAISDAQSSRSRTAVTVVGASTLAYVLRLFYLNYKAWRALGPSGLPPNPLGWVGNWILRLAYSKETRGLSIYNEPWKDNYAKDLSGVEAKLNRASFLPSEGLTRRKGLRPAIAKFVIPNREQKPAIDMMLKQLQTNLLGYINREYKDKTVLGLSKLETGSPALFLLENVPVHPVARTHKREICHGHLSGDPPDRSSHCTLSYEDAKEVIRKGWGERHPLAGSPIVGPSYLLIYAPRNEDEVEVLGTILRASTKFMISLAESEK